VTKPIIKEPIWKPEIPFYFYTGGLGGASAGLAYAAGLAGNRELARRAWAAALLGVGASPALLISDLGVPRRFLNMLRVFKVTSPMSVGSWILSAAGATTSVAALHAWTGRLAGPAAACRPAAAALGMPLSTYTAALVANTAVPAWHETRQVLPFLFAAGAATSAGAAAVMTTAPRDAGPARRLAIAGAAAELAAVQLTERRAGRTRDAYTRGHAGKLGKAGKAATAAGAAVLARAGRSRLGAVAGGALLTGGAVCERWSVFLAGKQSAADPSHTVETQRL
jgi:DMSO reductase anchor subunit